ncbi:MAG: hypothetical protein Q9167_007310 [Letrouitia subvulpina]
MDRVYALRGDRSPIFGLPRRAEVVYPQPVITFKAGKCAFDVGPSPPRITPEPTPGYVYLYEEDELMNFCWRPRSRPLTDPELKLVMPPADGRFIPYLHKQANSTEKRSPTNGRIFVLKFESSTERHLFWMQSKSQDSMDDPAWFSPRDLKIGQIVDQLLQGEQVDVQDSLANVTSAGGANDDDDDDGEDRMEGVRRESQSGAVENLASGDPFIGDPGNEGEESREGGADGGRAASMPSTDAATAVQNFLRSMQGNQNLQNQQSQPQGKLFTTLPDLLPTTTTIPVIDSASPSFIDTLLSQLPPELLILSQELGEPTPENPDPDIVAAAMATLSLDQKKDILRRVLRSPQFVQSLDSLTQAIRGGGLPGISDALGLEVENGGYIRRGGVPLGQGEAVEKFIDGVRRKVEKEREEGKGEAKGEGKEGEGETIDTD